MNVIEAGGVSNPVSSTPKPSAEDTKAANDAMFMSADGASLGNEAAAAEGVKKETEVKKKVAAKAAEPPPPPTTTDSDVDQAYQDILGRPADPEGVALWKAQGLSPQALRDALRNSDEGKARQATVDAAQKAQAEATLKMNEDALIAGDAASMAPLNTDPTSTTGQAVEAAGEQAEKSRQVVMAPEQVVSLAKKEGLTLSDDEQRQLAEEYAASLQQGGSVDDAMASVQAFARQRADHALVDSALADAGSLGLELPTTDPQALAAQLKTERLINQSASDISYGDVNYEYNLTDDQKNQLAGFYTAVLNRDENLPPELRNLSPEDLDSFIKDQSRTWYFQKTAEAATADAGSLGINTTVTDPDTGETITLSQEQIARGLELTSNAYRTQWAVKQAEENAATINAEQSEKLGITDDGVNTALASLNDRWRNEGSKLTSDFSGALEYSFGSASAYHDTVVHLQANPTDVEGIRQFRDQLDDVLTNNPFPISEADRAIFQSARDQFDTALTGAEKTKAAARGNLYLQSANEKLQQDEATIHELGTSEGGIAGKINRELFNTDERTLNPIMRANESQTGALEILSAIPESQRTPDQQKAYKTLVQALSGTNTSTGTQSGATVFDHNAQNFEAYKKDLNNSVKQTALLAGGIASLAAAPFTGGFSTVGTSVVTLTTLGATSAVTATGVLAVDDATGGEHSSKDYITTGTIAGGSAILGGGAAGLTTRVIGNRVGTTAATITEEAVSDRLILGFQGAVEGFSEDGTRGALSGAGRNIISLPTVDSLVFAGAGVLASRSGGGHGVREPNAALNPDFKPGMILGPEHIGNVVDLPDGSSLRFVQNIDGNAIAIPSTMTREQNLAMNDLGLAASIAEPPAIDDLQRLTFGREGGAAQIPVGAGDFVPHDVATVTRLENGRLIISSPVQGGVEINGQPAAAAGLANGDEVTVGFRKFVVDGGQLIDPTSGEVFGFKTPDLNGVVVARNLPLDDQSIHPNPNLDPVNIEGFNGAVRYPLTDPFDFVVNPDFPHAIVTGVGDSTNLPSFTATKNGVKSNYAGSMFVQPGETFSIGDGPEFFFDGQVIRPTPNTIAPIFPDIDISPAAAISDPAQILRSAWPEIPETGVLRTPEQVTLLQDHIDTGLQLIRNGQHAEAIAHFQDASVADSLGFNLRGPVSGGVSGGTIFRLPGNFDNMSDLSNIADSIAQKSMFQVPEGQIPSIKISSYEELFIPKSLTPEQSEFLAALNREVALVHAEEWIHSYQHITDGNIHFQGTPPAGTPSGEIDVATFLHNEGIELSDLFLQRYGRKDFIPPKSAIILDANMSAGIFSSLPPEARTAFDQGNEFLKRFEPGNPFTVVASPTI